MKTKANLLRRIAIATLSLMFISSAVFADGEANEVFLSGTTNTAAGDFVVTGTDDVYHFQGDEYAVFNVYYDNPQHNMKIAVIEGDDCKSFIAYTKGYWFKYNCTKEGFGVRKAMFSSPNVRDEFNHIEYRDQSVLVKERKIEKDQAIGLIAAYLPKLQG
ncbi:MAG: hypothetical protein GY790_09060 [Bacteroidetes bacterium]|nr:hypothetical protein [Bacteroidota bacterium]